MVICIITSEQIDIYGIDYYYKLIIKYSTRFRSLFVIYSTESNAIDRSLDANSVKPRKLAASGRWLLNAGVKQCNSS